MFVVIILIFLILVLWVLYNLGVFVKVEVEVKEIEELVGVYEDYNGPYKDTKKIQDKLYYKLLNEEKIETFKGFGIYYDNPKEIPKDKLRSKSGCILEEVDYDKIKELEKKYNIYRFEKGKYIVSQFPLKSQLSILGGVFKVYPKLDEFVKENNFKMNEVTEIYDLPGEKIMYIISISNEIKQKNI